MTSLVSIGSDFGRLRLYCDRLERGGTLHTDSLLVDAVAEGPGFRFKVARQVLLEAELVRFNGELAALYRALTGRARLHAFDGEWLEVIISGYGRGHIDGSVRLQNVDSYE